MSNNGRSLTPGEIALARSVYGDSIDYSTISIIVGRHPLVPFENPHAPGGNIYYPDRGFGQQAYSEDFSQETGALGFERKSIFIHEMAHVLQAQSGINVLASVILPQIGAGFNQQIVYDWSLDVQAGKSFWEMTPERQASLIEDYFRVKNGFDAKNSQLAADGFISGDTVEQIAEQILPEEITGVEPSRCFLPGTPITLADGVTTKPIEEIAAGDEVLSYTHDGTLVPGRVTATSSKTASIVLDWFGLGVTPGHVTLCGYVPDEESTPAGPFMGRHVPLIDILCADGAVVRQDGSLVRAATNEPVGSRADAFVHLAYSRTGEELKAGVSHEASIRVGTKLITGEGNTVRVLDVIETNGYQFDEETGLVSRPLDDGTPGVPGPLPFFGEPPKPEDHVLARSGTTLEAIHRAGEWEGEGSQLPAPTPARATPAAISSPMNRKQRRALMARGRRAH